MSFLKVNGKIVMSDGIPVKIPDPPIIQDNKIIGAVTNVLIDNTKLGYGISIITMLEEGEKS